MQPRESVGVGETERVMATSWCRHRASVDNYMGASLAREGGRLLRGECSEGRNPNGCGTKQGHETRVCLETAERLKKPVSGTGTGMDNPTHVGLARVLSLKGVETS